ncbi:MAG: hypothetical protein COB36_01000 [Alphaproteobacteria bacterium]|nr:MAG: hypothetical protein COB36_01000 [Alphaproteobacteria bacterium]
MSWFKNVWSGGLGVITFTAALVVTPIVSVYNGVDEMMEDNPQGVSNWAQFKEGASFGLIDAKDGLTPESTADAVYDSGKAVGEGALRFGERLIERASEDLDGVSDRFKDVSADVDSILKTQTSTNRFLDPSADYSLPEDPPEPEQ